MAVMPAPLPGLHTRSHTAQHLGLPERQAAFGICLLCWTIAVHSALLMAHGANMETMRHSVSSRELIHVFTC